MPATVQSILWWITVNVNKTIFMDKWVGFTQSHEVKKAFAVAEPGTEAGEHVHFVMELAEQLSQQTLKNHIDKCFEVSGKQKCVKVWDGILPSYMLKAPLPNIIINFGISDAELAVAAEENQKVQERIKIKEKKEKTQKTYFEIMEEIIEACKTDFCVGETRDGSRKLVTVALPKKNVWDTMLHTMNKYKVKAHSAEIERWFVTILRMIDVHNLDHMRDNIFSKLGI